MKRLLLLIFLFSALQPAAQTNPITGIVISLPQNPDASLLKWGAGSLTLSASARMLNGRMDPLVESSQVLVTIRKGGSRTCGGFSSSTAPAANFTSPGKTWSGANAVALIGQDCTLPPGDYELCVQFFGAGPTGPKPLSDEKCKSFSIREEAEQSYRPPQNISPAAGAIISASDAKRPVLFRWTPVIPRPQQPVVYRLRAWNLPAGQSSAQAMQGSSPVVDKDVSNGTQAAVSLPASLDSDETFVWTVQALDRDGKPVGGNNGTSEAFTFVVRRMGEQPSILTLTTPAQGSSQAATERPRFMWTHERQLPGAPSVYDLKIVEIKGDQSPEEAFRHNKPFFEKDSLPDRVYQYPSSAPAFAAGKKYGWKVEGYRTSSNADVSRTMSPINEFIVKSMPPPPPCPVINVSSNFSCALFTIGSSITNTSTTLSIVSWTISSPNTILVSNGVQVPTGTFVPMSGMPGNFPTINAGQSVNASTVGVLQPNSGSTIILIYTFHLSNGQTCEVETMPTWYPNCAAAICACGSWGGFDYRYYADGILTGTPPIIQAPLTGNAGAITVAQGSRIWPQGGYTCLGNCVPPVYRYDLAKVGTTGLLVDHTTNSTPGKVAEVQLDCGDYVLTAYPSCIGAVILPCPTAIIQIHVDCTNPCNCGTWSSVTAKVGSGSVASVSCNNAGNPVQMRAADSITVNATLTCIPSAANCSASQQVANIYYANGSLAASNISLPLTKWVVPNAAYTGLLKVELKGKCGAFNCPPCILYFTVLPPVCTCTWGTIEVGFGIGPQSIATCGQTIQMNPGETIRVGSAALACSFPSCTRNVKADLVAPNGTVLLSNQSLPLTYTPPAGSCGVFKVVLKGKCGTVSCSNCEVNFYVPCCACTDNWNDIHYSVQGTTSVQTTHCGETVSIPFGTGLTNIGTGYNCNYNSCVKSSPTYKVYGPNSTTTVFASGTGLTFNFPASAGCGLYKVVFSGNCGVTACSCVMFIKVAAACCEYLSVVSNQKLLVAPIGSVGFITTFSLSSAIIFDSVKVQILSLTIANIPRSNANISEIVKSPVPLWTASQAQAITNAGNAVWFTATGGVSATAGSLVFKGKIVNLGAPININLFAVRLRYTFYRHNATCGAMVCEKDINF